MLFDVFLRPVHPGALVPLHYQESIFNSHKRQVPGILHPRHELCFKTKEELPITPSRIPRLINNNNRNNSTYFEEKTFIHRAEGVARFYASIPTALAESLMEQQNRRGTRPSAATASSSSSGTASVSATMQQMQRLGKMAAESPASDLKMISKDIPSKTWKAVRFSSTFSRGSNTPTIVTVSKAVQTASTAYKLRLKRWPAWPSASITPSGYYRSPSGNNSVLDSFYHPLWIRRILSMVFSQFGIVVFLASWISGNAALFQLLEQGPDVRLVNDVMANRNELVVSLATELRQVFPYEMAWRRKIDDYFIKFENSLNNATQRGYSSTAHSRSFYKWDYLDFFLFSLQLVTGQGFGTDVPKTEWSFLLSIPCVMIGMPFMWLLLLDMGAKWADTLSAMIEQFRWNLSRRYPDVVSLQSGSQLFPTPPKVLQNGGSPTMIQQNGNGPIRRTEGNGSLVQPYPKLDEEDLEDPSAIRPIWTIQPHTTELGNMPIPGVSMVHKKSLLQGDGPHQATPWVATVFTVLYPVMGSVVFGLWADLSIASSFVLPLTSLMLISPPPPLVSYWWRSTFHLYLLLGWVLLIASCLLWLNSWRNLFKQWTHDLSIKRVNRAYPIQVR